MKNKTQNINTNEGFFVLSTALKQIANNIDLNGLLQVVLKTENPELAVKMLAGVYKTPNIPINVVLKDNRNVGDSVCTLVEYNPWENTIHFSFEKKKSVHIYVQKDCDTSVITSSNYQDFKKSWNNDDVKSFSVKLEEVETRTDSVSLQSWMAGEIVPVQEQEFDYTQEREFVRRKQEDIF